MYKLEWTAPMRFDGFAEGVGSIVMDSAPRYGGSGAGPTPMEAVLLALAGCTGMDVVSILRKKRAPLEELTIEVSAERATEHPKVFTKIHLRYLVRGAGLGEDDVRKAITLSQDKYCSVSAMLRQTAAITWDVAINAGVQAGGPHARTAPAGSTAA